MNCHREKLQQYIESNIDHSGNPQAFRLQLESEIDRHLKAENAKLKQARSKMRVAQIQEEEIKRREELRAQLDQRMSQNIKSREDKLKAMTKSMSELSQRKQNYVQEKVRQNRATELKESLQKIKEIEEKKEEMLQSQLIRSHSFSGTGTAIRVSRLDLRQKQVHDSYAEMLTQLKIKKNIFRSPQSQLQELYAAKGKKALEQSQAEKEAENDHKIGQRLHQIEEARKRKEQRLRKEAEKVRNEELFRREQVMDRQMSLKEHDREKRKQMELKVGEKSTKKAGLPQGTVSKRWQSMGEASSASLSPAKQHEWGLPKQNSFRGQIRKCIDSFNIRSPSYQ